MHADGWGGDESMWLVSFFFTCILYTTVDRPHVGGGAHPNGADDGGGVGGRGAGVGEARRDRGIYGVVYNV